ncbi:MAG: hypothetical protein JWP91_3934 [Fibrobacteres bacterium]|nr:hypothetical protein [Fibrobacterota bacterium]
MRLNRSVGSSQSEQKATRNMKKAFPSVIILLLALQLIGCKQKAGNDSTGISFPLTRDSTYLPVPNSAVQKTELDNPECFTGWNFKIKVPFKSLVIFEYYDSVFASFGYRKVDSSIGIGLGWRTSPSLAPLDSSSEKSFIQQEYQSPDGKVKCRVYLEHNAKALGRSGIQLLPGENAQIVTSICATTVAELKNRCEE